MATPLTSGRNKWTFVICFLLLAAVHTEILRQLGLSIENALTDSLISNVLLAGVSMLIIKTLSYYRPRESGYLYLVVWCIILSILWSAALRYVLLFFAGDDAFYLSFIIDSTLVRFYLALPITIATALLSMLWYNLEEIREQDLRQTATENMTREAELLKLRQQLQPHFLFNSLNSISALAGADPEKAREMIYQLSEFLRGTLKKEEHTWVSLEEELQHLQLYLEIEKVRFGHRLTTVVESDAAALSSKIPPMILQPVVENAIKFGLYDTTGPVTITVKTGRNDHTLTITVTNPFDKQTAAPNHGTGFGLRSLHRRLYLLFARNDLLSTHHADSLFTTTIKIPQHDKSTDH